MERRLRRLAPLAAFLTVAAACGEGRQADSALLVTLDTTIPEALSCYGGPPGATPHLDRLVSEGVLFTNARTVAPMTLPAHASMLTGLYPLRHSVRMNGTSTLPEESVTLAERLRAAGYQTAAFLSAVVLDAEFGLDQGFDVYDHPRTPERVDQRLASRRRAAEVVDLALAWLEGRDEARPFFLWLHFFDPHGPLDPPPAFLARAGGNAYQAEVSYMDAELGRFLGDFEERGLLESSLVLVVADHGEGLGRHGEATHMAFAYDTTLRVPLILRPRGGLEQGRREDAIVSVVDVHETIALELGLDASRDLDGRSLLDPVEDRGVYFETHLGFLSYGWSPLCGWADAEGKYVDSSRPEFFRMPGDRDETDGAIAGIDVEPYRRSISELAALPRLEGSGLGEAFGGLRGQIEKLGYAGTGSDPTRLPEPLVTMDDRPAPHERVQAFADFLTAQGLAREKRTAEVIALLEPIVRENPRNHKAAFVLARNLMEERRFAEAIPHLKASIEHAGNERTGADLNLGLCYERIGDVDAAIRQYRVALEHVLGPPGAMENLVFLLESVGRSDEAREYRERLRAERPQR